MPGLVLSYEAALGNLHTVECDDQVVDVGIGTFVDERILIIVRTNFENAYAFTWLFTGMVTFRPLNTTGSTLYPALGEYLLSLNEDVLS